jgi:pimeloyl-ACP methyl ester carboxylesterase
MDELISYYRVIIVEKPGYGFSSDTNRPRTLVHIVEELRAALSAAGEKGPYLLCGHSMSGCEAVYWAKCHPEEVRGIAMLDAPAPLCYQTLPLPPAAVWSLFALLRYIGLRRLFLHFPFFVRRMNSHLNGLTFLDPKFLPMVKAMQAGRYLTRPMREEMRRLKENSAQAGGNLPAGIKPLMFIASDTKTRWAMLQPEEDAFIARNHALVIEITGKHNLQHYAPKEIADHIRQYFDREDAS